jgi:hypothetical protein
MDVTAVTAERISRIYAPLQDEEVALCQRIFDEICQQQSITDDEARDKLAANIVYFYQHGVKDESALKRMFL